MLEGTKSNGREACHIRICLEQREMEERRGKDGQDEDNSSFFFFFCEKDVLF